MSSQHASVVAVADALTAAGQAEAAESIRILPAEVRTAAAAAAALDVPVGAIANSLVFLAHHPAATGPDTAPDTDTETVEPVLVLTSGAHRVDTERVAALLGAERLTRAPADEVNRSTGQVIGGVAPTGHPRRLMTVVDTALARFDVVWAAAGHPRSVYPTTFAGLLALTEGRAEDVAGDSAA